MPRSRLALLLLCACASDADNYCENVGDCAQGGSYTWIQTCQANLGVASTEATQTGCASQFAAFYSCTSKNYTCSGATPLFPGCDDAGAVLNACIANARAQPDGGFTWCQELAAANATCGTDAAVPEGCDALRDCEAQCFLTNVNDPCAPDIDGLDAYTECAATCPTVPSGSGDAGSD